MLLARLFHLHVRSIRPRCETQNQSRNMTSKQHNKLTMVQAVIAACNRNKSVWKNVPGFSNSVDGLSARADNIIKLAQKQIDDSTGTTRDKRQLREELTDLALHAAGAVRAYAVDTNNQKLGSSA